MGTDGTERGNSIPRHANLVTIRLKQCPQPLPNGQLVIYNQDFHTAYYTISPIPPRKSKLLTCAAERFLRFCNVRATIGHAYFAIIHAATNSAAQVKGINSRSGTRKENMKFEILQKLIERAKHPRWRKRHKRRPPKFVRPSSNVQAVLLEMEEDWKHPPPCPNGFDDPLYAHRLDGLSAVGGVLMTAEKLAIAAGMDCAEKLCELKDRKKRQALLERRRSYYERENEQRRSERKLIREAVLMPENRHPTPTELTEAYLRRRESDEWTERFGTLILDLEEHERRIVVTEGNRFTGSTGGVKAWLAANCPLLAAHYQTCQRYKRLVQDNPPDDASAA